MKFANVFIRTTLIAGLIFITSPTSFSAGKTPVKSVHHIVKKIRPAKVGHHNPKVRDNRRSKAERQMRNFLRQRPQLSQKNTTLKTRLVRSGASISLPKGALKPSGLYFFDDMENGVGGWSIDALSDTLWHLTESNSNSPTHSWWLGNENSGSYNIGARVDQSLVSPAFDLTGVTGPLALTFLENYVTESGKDLCMIDVTTDDGVSWTGLRENASGNSGGWINSSVNLNAYTGKMIKIRFHFDTGDSLFNDFPGWFIDDVSLIGNPGTISGTVFLDKDQDQSDNNNDVGLGGWSVTATAEGMSATTITNQTGYYEFVLPAGSYTVAESLHAGWTQTSPPSGSYAIDISAPGEIFNGMDFGNWHPVVNLIGYVFADDNRNTVQDSGEVPVQGQFVDFFSGPEQTNYSLESDSTGHFSIATFDTGTYVFTQDVDEELDSYWDIQTWPLNGQGYTIHVENFTDTVPLLRFGTFYPSRHPWIISGYVFNDDNMNGVRDSNETGFRGQVVDISGGINNETDDAVTAGVDGYFSDAVFDTGQYAVSQEIYPSNQIQTWPPNGVGYTIDVGISTDTIPALRFGTFSFSDHPWKISGFVFADENKNSVQDTDEIGESGQDIILQGESNDWNDDEESTNRTGYFTFYVEDTGLYDIYQDLDPDNAAQTSPPNKAHYSVDVTYLTDSITGLRFGTFYADQVDCRISGRVFIDLNKNGVQDAGEPGYANVDLLLGGAGDYNRVVATDSTGKYTFSGLPPGNYTVTLQLNSDQYWITTSPGSYNFTFPIQTRVDTAYFGVVIIHQTASIAGTVFNDTNYNTVRDPGEPGLGPWVIALSGWTARGTRVSTAVTSDTNGNYIFSTLWPGTYSVTEEFRNLWIQTYPKNFNGYMITLNPESTITRIDFGNHQDSSFVTAYRSFIPEDLALTKDIKGNQKWTPIKKLYPAKVSFSCVFGNTSSKGRTATSLQMHFTLTVLDYLEVFPQGTQTFLDSTSVVITFPGGILFGDSVHISGVARESAPGKTDKQKIHSSLWTFSDNSTAGAWAKFMTWSYVAYLPPNPVDLLMAMTGHPVQVGSVAVHSILMKKYTDIGKSLIDHAATHSRPPTCLGYYQPGHMITKQRPYLSPKYDVANNKLFSEALALRVNIMASDLNLTPPGFGDLIYDENSGNPLNGKSIRTIADLLDQYLSSNDYSPVYHVPPGPPQCHIPAGYEWLDSLKLWQTIRNINQAFTGPIDVYYWYPGTVPKLSLTPTRSVKLVPFLHIDTSFLQAGKIRPMVKNLIHPPDQFALSQNYPNPFNPTTTIEFSLPTAANVTVRIYNILGQEVGTLIDRQAFDAGYQSVTFDAARLPSGVYFYRILAERVDENGIATGQIFTQVKKMILLR